MTCPHCYCVVVNRAAMVCPHCGATLVWDISIRSAPPLPVAQARLPAPTPTKIPLRPLLTGNPWLDTTLGFCDELVGTALFLYALWVLWRLFHAFPEPTPLSFLGAIGMLATAALLFYHAGVMRRRYPAFGLGWQIGRNTWGGGVDSIITTVYGLIAVTVLFPLGMLLCVVGSVGGTAAWLFVLAIVYGVGILARRMLADEKGQKAP